MTEMDRHAESFQKRNQARLDGGLEHLRPADVAGMNDSFAALQSGKGLGTEKAVSIGNHSNFHAAHRNGLEVDSQCRFSELEKLIPDVTQKMLIQQLKGLQQDDIVQRTLYPEVPPRVEYALTALGHALGPAMTALIDWAELRHQHEAKRLQAGAL